jgi:hypothetical protein
MGLGAELVHLMMQCLLLKMFLSPMWLRWCVAENVSIGKTTTAAIRIPNVGGARMKHLMRMTFAVTEKGKAVNLMRDRLIKILREPIPVIKGYDTIGESRMSIVDAEKYADRLISNGVIVPPCKVGDTVYVINDFEVEETTVFSMRIKSTDSHWITFVRAKITDHFVKFKDGYGSAFDTFIFGKTVFSTREEAERALKGGDE